MSDFLLELLSEEIPARMQARACKDLQSLFEAELEKAGLKAKAVETYATPRRLALIARGLPDQTQPVSEEIKGPRASAPPQALEGFLRKTGLAQRQLVERDGVFFATVETPGRATAAVLAEAVPAIVHAFPWPKSMRWGDASVSTESLRWVRPLQGIVALLGDKVVEFEIAGVKSGAASLGHRFHHPGAITIGSANDYAEKLRACRVVLDPAERRRIIAEGAAKAAAAVGLMLVEDEGLLAENAGLAEWPMPLLGGFDPAFLDVPREVIQLTMRTNQKYFALTDGDGALAPYFICVANIEASDGGAAIVAGNERVLSARLSDAKFFWEQDLKVPLAEQAAKLGDIVFHEKLGTLADKVERVATLARWLVEESVIPAEAGISLPEGNEIPASAGMTKEELADAAETAARLAKADLVTGSVGEFPELQGVIGGHLARAQGKPDAIADAIRDHYKPVGQGDDVPTAPVTVAVSLADKLDTLVGFFAIDEKPTGSKDPFALRRAALAIIELIEHNSIRVRFRELLAETYRYLVTQVCEKNYCLARDPIDPGYLSPILTPKIMVDGAAYLRNPLEILVLNEEPPASAVEFAPDGVELWSPSELRKRGLARHTLLGFVENTNTLTEYAFDRLRERERRARRRADVMHAVLPRGPRVDMRGVKFAIEGVETQGGRGKRWFYFPNTAADDDLVRIMRLGQALQNFIATEDGANLLAAYKRAANILKKEGWPPTEHEANKKLSYTPEKEESALIAALDSAEPKAAAAVEAEDFEGAMAALATLRAPVDAFFDKVTVNDPDPVKRAARLDLLLRMRDAVHRVADFSRIEG